MDNISIADGFEFPKLNKAIDELYDQFMTVYQVTRILNDQAKVNDDVDRERGIEIMGQFLKCEMDRLLNNVNELVDFQFLPMKQAA